MAKDGASGAPGHALVFLGFLPQNFSSGSWMERLSNLQKEAKRERGAVRVGEGDVGMRERINGKKAIYF